MNSSRTTRMSWAKALAGASHLPLEDARLWANAFFEPNYDPPWKEDIGSLFILMAEVVDEF